VTEAGKSATTDTGQARTVPEAELKKTDAGLIPQGEGWFVLNARDASWIRSEERGQDTDFEGGQEWAQLGFRIQVIGPGQRGVYHGERGQEDFLVVSGECVLVIEGEERRLKAWDFVHCPPWTRHVFVGAGDAQCVIVMAGSRTEGFEAVYAVNEVAAKYDASVPEETSSPDEAYARWGPEKRVAYGGWLPS
jgi:quercetin dioxygenase-like cupin family protein